MLPFHGGDPSRAGPDAVLSGRSPLQGCLVRGYRPTRAGRMLPPPGPLRSKRGHGHHVIRVRSPLFGHRFPPAERPSHPANPREFHLLHLLSTYRRLPTLGRDRGGERFPLCFPGSFHRVLLQSRYCTARCGHRRPGWRAAFALHDVALRHGCTLTRSPILRRLSCCGRHWRLHVRLWLQTVCLFLKPF
jgi:hypothetical protein